MIKSLFIFPLLTHPLTPSLGKRRGIFRGNQIYFDDKTNLIVQTLSELLEIRIKFI